jgi:hypothetical protein
MTEILATIPGWIGLAALTAAYQLKRGGMQFEVIPTCRISDLVSGLSECQGTAVAEPNGPQSLIDKKKLIHAKWEVLEHFRRKKMVRDLWTNLRKEKITEGWRTKTQTQATWPFTISDKTGQAKVTPKKLNCFGLRTREAEITPEQAQIKPSPDATGRFRLKENALVSGTHVYLAAEAAINWETVEHTLTGNTWISTQGEGLYEKSQKIATAGLLATGIGAGGMTGWLMSNTWPGAIVMAGVFAILATGTQFLAVYNAMKELENRNKQAKANIDVEIQRRTDLLKTLETLQKESQEHEKTTLKQKREISMIQKEENPNLKAGSQAQTTAKK